MSLSGEKENQHSKDYVFYLPCRIRDADEKGNSSVN
jgi:hypothetical protein